MPSAQLFQNGQSQAVRLPREFRFEGNSVAIRRIGEAIILQPHKKGWNTLFDSLNQFSTDFMEKREQPAAQSRKDF